MWMESLVQSDCIFSQCPTAKDGQQEQMVKNVRWKQRWEGNVWFWRGEILALVAAGSSQAGGCTLHEELYFPGGWSAGGCAAGLMACDDGLGRRVPCLSCIGWCVAGQT